MKMILGLKTSGLFTMEQKPRFVILSCRRGSLRYIRLRHGSTGSKTMMYAASTAAHETGSAGSELEARLRF
jgi:hypothetical protein